MATTQRLSNWAASTAANRVCETLDSGWLDLYTGLQPLSPDVPVTNQMRLVRLRFSRPAFVGAVAGGARANPISPGVAIATGGARWFRATAESGAPVFDGSVGDAGANLKLSNAIIVEGATVVVNSLTYTQQRSTNEVSYT